MTSIRKCREQDVGRHRAMPRGPFRVARQAGWGGSWQRRSSSQRQEPRMRVTRSPPRQERGEHGCCRQ